MEIIIKRNDAFEMLSKAVGYSETTLEKNILKRMIDERMMCGDREDCGFSLVQIADSSGYKLDDLMNIIFPDGVKNPEVEQLMDSVFIWGTGSEFPCSECGCETGIEYENFSDDDGIRVCENSECKSH